MTPENQNHTTSIAEPPPDAITARLSTNLFQGSLPYILTLIVVCLVVYFFGLGNLKLWDVDEGMHASMAKNMVLSGDWVTPVFNGEPFFDKPVLFNWLVALSFSLLGFTEFAARLPSALLGTGCVITTFLLGARLYGRTTGFWSALVLATSLEFIVLSRIVVYDVPFTFFTTVALYFFCSGYLDERRRPAWFLALHAATACAILTKGALGFCLPWLAILGFLAWQKRLSLLRQMQLLPGGIIIAVIVVPWFALMERANPGYLHYFIVKQHFANLLGHAGDFKARHPEPWYYFVPILLLGLFPWSAALFGAVRAAFRRWSRETEPMSLFLLIWLAGFFLLFSLANSKLSTYILPLFPAAAVLIGHYLRDMLDIPSGARGRGLAIITGCAFLLVLAVTTYVIVADPWTNWQQDAGVVWSKFEQFMLMLCALFLLSALFAWRRRYRASLGVIALLAPAMALTVNEYVGPDMQPYKSSAEIGLWYDHILAPGEKMVFAGARMLDSAVYYTGREAIVLHSPEQVHAYLAHKEKVYVLLRGRINLSDECTGEDCFYVVASLGNKSVITNRLGPGEKSIGMAATYD